MFCPKIIEFRFKFDRQSRFKNNLRKNYLFIIPPNGKGCLTFPSFQQLQPFRKLQAALAEARARVRSNLRYPRLEGQGDRRG